jgi:hypothetical protein
VTPQAEERRIGNIAPTALMKAALDSLAAVKAILTVGGLLLYFVIRTVYVSFYGTLGVDPADANHGRADILESAAIGIVTWTLLSLAVTAIMIAVSFLRSSTVDSLVDARVARAAFSWTLIFVALLPMVAVVGSPAFLDNAWNVSLVSGCAVLLAVAVALSRKTRTRSGAVAAAIVLLLLTVLVAQRWGEYQANRALSGLPVRPVTAMSLLNIRVEPVCLTVTSAAIVPAALRGPRRVGYLASRDDFTLLVIPGRSGGVVRLPSSSVASLVTSQAVCT